MTWFEHLVIAVELTTVELLLATLATLLSRLRRSVTPFGRATPEDAARDSHT